MRIGEESGANGIGSTTFSNMVPFDILNVERGLEPDAGSYESTILDEED